MQVKDEAGAGAGTGAGTEGVQRATDRRRPGRRAVSPELIPLLRSDAEVGRSAGIDWELVGGALMVAAFITAGVSLRFVA